MVYDRYMWFMVDICGYSTLTDIYIYTHTGWWFQTLGFFSIDCEFHHPN